MGTAPYDGVLRQVMSDYYVAFAASGDPNGPARPLWPKYMAGSENHLELGREVIAKLHLRQAEWDAQDRLARRHGATRP